MLRIDKLGFGLLIGFIAPLFGISLFYLLKFYPASISNFLYVLKIQPSLITGIASLSLFVNIALLTLFLNKRRDKTAIGIFVATLIYGIISLIVKFTL